jgi:hypothetical protein
MADVNINFGTDDSLDSLVKDMQKILKLVKDIKKADIIDDDEALKAKKLTAEMLKIENAIKKQEGAAKRLADQEQRRTDKLKQEKGIIGGLEKEVKDLTKAWKSAGTAVEKATAKKNLDRVKKQLTDAKNTTASWGKALGSFQFKFNALGNIAANVLSKMTQQAKEFLREAWQMSLVLEGVENAFNKIDDPNLLGNLQEATRGMVNNLELMKGAVTARNLNIPLEKLGTFFEFATNRSIETGESVNALVDDIVKGLGRKSVLILDNLGLSVIDINEEFKKTGNFVEAAANVIDREMEKAGEVVDTKAVKVQKLKTDWENVKLEIGTGVSNAIFDFGKNFNYIAENTIIDFINMRKEAKGLADDINNIPTLIEEVTVFATKEQIETLKTLREDLKLKKAVVEETNIADIKAVLIAKAEVKAIEDRIKAIEDLGKAQKEFEAPAPDDDSFIFEQIKATSEFSVAVKKGQKEEELNVEKAFNDALEAENERMLQGSKDQEEQEVKDKEDAETRKQAAIKQTFRLASNFSNSLASLVERNKQIELSAAGDNAEKRLEIEKEYAKKQQAISVSQAIINGAQAVTEVWKTWADNPPIAAVFTALAVGTVAAQIATIKKQKFAKGGDVKGPLHSQGGVQAELEGGEYVINRASTSKYRSLIEGINENDQLKIMMAMDKDRMLPTVKEDPTLKKILKAIERQPVYGESPSYYIEERNGVTYKLRKDA